MEDVGTRIGDKNYGDRFRFKSDERAKKKSKRVKKRKVDLVTLDLGDLSKQGKAWRINEDLTDRFHFYLDMMGNRDYVKGNQVLEETIDKEKKSLQKLSDLNLNAIENEKKSVTFSKPLLEDTDDIKHVPTSLGSKLKDEQDVSRIDPAMRFDINPYNKWNHQYVTGKVLTRREAESGFGLPNKKFLTSTLSKALPAVNRAELPQTSAQEVGWFTKIYHSTPSAIFTPTKILDKSETTIVKERFNKNSVTAFRRDPRVNHPKCYTEISRYMDTYWGYYPPPVAKFHPKDN